MDYEKNAIEILRILAGNSGFVLADSGGKDSSVLKHIAIRSGVKFCIKHNHTTVDAPETVYFVRQEQKRLQAMGIDYKIVYPKESMWQLIIRKCTPPTRLIRYCCSELKESNGLGEKLVTGVRKAESKRRKENQGVVTFAKPHKDVRERVDGVNFSFSKAGGVVVLNLDNDENRQLVENCYRTQKTIINPLIDWEDDFIWWYIRHYDLPLNPLYSCGWSRIGCIGCPMAGKHRYEEFEKYPKYKNLYIWAFDKMLENRKERGLKNCFGWVDGKSVFRWWMEDKTTPGQMEIQDWLNEIGIFDTPI